MTILNTNLGVLLDNIIMEAPVKVSNLDTIKIENLQDGHKADAVESAWVQLQQDIFHFFKAKKGTANMMELIATFAEQINFLNENIEAKDISYKMEGKYIKAYFRKQRIAQLSTYNAKLLPNSKGEGFLLWSVLGHITCNGKTKICAGFCYNNSKSFNKNLALKIDCLILSLLDVFVPVMEKMIQFTPHQKTYVRIHEDGDFYSNEYFEKWMQIAKNNPKFEFEAYTKEPTLLEKINEINASQKNMLLRFSIMEDTNADVVKYVKENNIHSYIALGENTADKKASKVFEYIPVANRCLMSCQLCKKCYKKSSVMVFTKLHK